MFNLILLSEKVLYAGIGYVSFSFAEEYFSENNSSFSSRHYDGLQYSRRQISNNGTLRNLKTSFEYYYDLLTI